jgi:hypothetical protein
MSLKELRGPADDSSASGIGDNNLASTNRGANPILSPEGGPVPAVNAGEMKATSCQDRLMFVWIVGLVIVVLLLLTQIMSGIFQGKEVAVIGWCTQALSPLLGSMVAKWAGVGRSDNRVVRTPVFWSAACLSALYICMIVAFLGQSAIAPKIENSHNNIPISATDQKTLEEHIQRSVELLTTDSLLLGLVMVPLGCVITACFGGKPPTKVPTPRRARK